MKINKKKNYSSKFKDLAEGTVFCLKRNESLISIKIWRNSNIKAITLDEGRHWTDIKDDEECIVFPNATLELGESE